MTQFVKGFLIAVCAVVFFMAAFVFPAAADVELTDVSWETIGTTVRFHVQFHNPDLSNPSGDVSGALNTQPFGAFVPNNGQIGTFDVPPLAPDSFFDIWYDVALSDLPPSAERLTPTGGASSTSTGLSSAPVGCPPDLFWAGNVDVFWSGPGGSGQANYHFGTLQICPGGPSSYIHIFGDCQDPSGVSWSFSPLCSGWTATLVADDGFGMPGGPAANPLPSGFFDGWICVTAGPGVPVGSTCCFDLLMTCGASTVPINICADACIWEPVSTETSTWGKIKSMYQE
jgi:hypothetical protein